MVEVVKQKYSYKLNLSNIQINSGICVFNEAISKNDCSKIISECAYKAGWQKAITTGELLGKQTPSSSPRQSDSLFITADPNLKEMDDFIHFVFVRCLSKYLSLFNIDSAEEAGISQDEGYIMLRYLPGGYYNEHIDYSSVSNSKLHRAVSGLIYVNDDYIGGEISFRLQGISIKPKTGTIILFPSIFTHPHSSEKIKAGIKYSIVTWWQ
jgi:hypothetical protein